jgi:uncharacterized membrane protein
MSMIDRIGWSLMAFLSLGVAGYAAFHVATGFVHLPPDVAQNTFVSPYGLYLHITASAVALALGPFQFLRGLRSRMPWLHRWTGRTYVAACLLGGLAGGAIALYSTAGLAAGAGFLGLAIAWLLTTTLAFAAALRRDFETHRRWMVRSFALTFAAVTLRIYLPIGLTLHPDGFVLPYTIIAWICWVPNLILAEVWLAARQGTPIVAAN